MGEQGLIGPRNRLLGIEDHLLESIAGLVKELEQLGPNLLLCGIGLLVSFHDIEIDDETAGFGAPIPIAAGDLGIALGAQVPERRGIFHGQPKIVARDQGKQGRGIGAEIFPHAGIEAVIDLGDDDIKVWSRCTDDLKPAALKLQRQFGPVSGEVKPSIPVPPPEAGRAGIED